MPSDDVATAESTSRRLLNEGRLHEANRKFFLATRAYRAALDASDAEPPELRAELWRSLARTWRSVGSCRDAVEAARRALEARRDLTDSPIELADDWMLLAGALRDVADVDAAVAAATEALTLRRAALSTDAGPVREVEAFLASDRTTPVLVIHDVHGEPTALLLHGVVSVGCAGAGLSLNYARVDKAHATISRDGKRWMVVDHHSVSGTWVNGERVRGDRELALGDELRIGNVRTRFLAAPPAGVPCLPPPLKLDFRPTRSTVLARAAALDPKPVRIEAFWVLDLSDEDEPKWIQRLVAVYVDPSPDGPRFRDVFLAWPEDLAATPAEQSALLREIAERAEAPLATSSRPPLDAPRRIDPQSDHEIGAPRWRP